MTKQPTLPLPMSRTLHFAEQVDQQSIVRLTEKILEINDDDTHLDKLYEIHGLVYDAPPIEIYIDSYGGLVYQVFGLLGVMERSETPIHTIVTGAAMSCGFLILISGHKRFGYGLSTPLYHQVSSSSNGTVKEMSEDLVETKRLQQKIEKITLKKTKIPKKRLKQIYKRKIDWFMTAKEAKKLGVIDEII